MKILGASIATIAVWYVLRRRRIEAPRRDRPAPPTAPMSPAVPGALTETDLRYLAETFEHVNDRVIAQTRSWDRLSAALLGAIVAVYVLFVDKAEIYWLALLTLVIPAALLYGNTEDRVRYSPDSEAVRSCLSQAVESRRSRVSSRAHTVCIQPK